MFIGMAYGCAIVMLIRLSRGTVISQHVRRQKTVRPQLATVSGKLGRQYGHTNADGECLSDRIIVNPHRPGAW